MGKAPPPHSMHDVHECYQQTDYQGVKINRWVTTPKRNVKYAIARRTKQTLEIDKKYPKGTFFVITDVGKMPEFMKPKNKINGGTNS